MSFSQAVKVCLTQKYADFSGRAGRAEYWWFALFSGLVFGFFYVITVMAAINGVRPLAVVSGLAMVVVWFALLSPGLAVAVRRLHDLNTGMSGWFLLVSFIPFGGLALLIMFVMEGGPDNQYGPRLGGSYGTAPAGAHPAGWYADPSEPAQLRYWTGIAWSDQTHRP